MATDNNQTEKPNRRLRDDLREIRERCAKLPVIDDRTPEQIIGYDARGLPAKG